MQRSFFILKEWMKDSVWFSDGMLHLNVGLALFLAMVLILRRNPRRVVYAWVFVALLQTVNEVFDAWIGISRSGDVNWNEMGKDFLATLFWPSVLLILWKPLMRSGK